MQDPNIPYKAIVVADNGACYLLDFMNDNNGLAVDHLHHVVLCLDERDFNEVPVGFVTVFWKRARAENWHQFRPGRYFGGVT